MNHTISALRYRLIAGPACLEPLQILASRATRWRDRNVTFFVLGASHALRLTGGPHPVTEMLTCLPIEEPGPVLLDPPGDRDQVDCAEVAGLVCRVRIARFALPSDPGLEGRFPDACLLGYRFPAADTGPAPETQIGWRLEENRLIVETVHTYPEEGQGVHTC